MKFVGRIDRKCECCGDYKYNAPFYEWFSILENKVLAIVCKKCIVRENFGSNYRNNKKYQKWIEENK